MTWTTSGGDHIRCGCNGDLWSRVVDTGQTREAGRSTQGVRLLSMEGGDKVAAAVVIPAEETNGNGNGTPPLIQ